MLKLTREEIKRRRRRREEELMLMLLLLKLKYKLLPTNTKLEKEVLASMRTCTGKLRTNGISYTTQNKLPMAI
jgi:hypothetical protein